MNCRRIRLKNARRELAQWKRGTHPAQQYAYMKDHITNAIAFYERQEQRAPSNCRCNYCSPTEIKIHANIAQHQQLNADSFLAFV